MKVISKYFHFFLCHCHMLQNAFFRPRNLSKPSLNCTSGTHFYTKTQFSFLAKRKFQRMEINLFHFVPPPCGIFRTQHVCGCGGGKLPQMSGRARKRRKSSQGRKKSQENRGAPEKYEHYNRLIAILFSFFVNNFSSPI